MIAPPGFALENFDAIGRWRDVDNTAVPVDASGQMPDGTRFTGLAEFRAMLLKEPAQFAGTITEKLLMYALGRGIDAADMPAIRRIVRASAPAYRLSDVILGIVSSVPFQQRRAAERTDESRPRADRVAGRLGLQ